MVLSKNELKVLVNNEKNEYIDIQTDFIEDVFDNFIGYSNKVIYLNTDNGRLTEVETLPKFESALKIMVLNKYPEYFNILFENGIKLIINAGILYSFILLKNDFQIIKYESNLFEDGFRIQKDYDNGIAIIISNRYYIRESNYDTIHQKHKDMIINDFKDHFPRFDEFLKLIVDMRFAKDRKASFVRIKAYSNWGKSFLSGILQNLGIGLEVDYHNITNTGANDIHPIQVKNSFVLIIDEYKTFSQEMKKLTHSFTFAPKFGMSETVELYMKLLLSAESSASETGSVDEQIVNRLIMFDVENKKSNPIKLDERKVYQKFGNEKYMNVLVDYSEGVLRSHFKSYLDMDEYEASREADNAVRKAFKQEKLETTDINRSIRETLMEVIRELIELGFSNNHAIEQVRGNIIVLTGNKKYKNHIFIKQPAKTFEVILKNSVSESEYKKMRYKLTDIQCILNILETNKVIKIEKRPYKGMILSNTIDESSRYFDRRI